MSALPASFLAKTRETSCLVWIGSTNSKGYGIVNVGNGVRALAHRVAYEAEYGPIPDGMVLDHLCRVRNCVNPMHLEVVTIAENNRRGRSLSALKPGGVCSNGHRLADESAIYTRPNGVKECRECIRAGRRANRAGRPRPTTQRRAPRVARDLTQVDAGAGVA